MYLLQATIFYLDNNMIKILHTAFKALTLLLHPVSPTFNLPPKLILQTAVMVIIRKHSFLSCDSHNKITKISLYFSLFLCFIHTSFLTGLSYLSVLSPLQDPTLNHPYSPHSNRPHCYSFPIVQPFFKIQLKSQLILLRNIYDASFNCLFNQHTL